MPINFELQLFADLGIRTVKTIEGLQAALANSKADKITIISTILINANTVIDFNGKSVKLSKQFSDECIFKLNAPNINLTLKSSEGSGGIIPAKSDKNITLISNSFENNNVTFDAGFTAEYSDFKNFYIVEKSNTVALNFSGANITTNNCIYAKDIKISGGNIICTGEEAAIGINGSFNMSGGNVKTNSENYVSIVFYGGVKANISGGTTGTIRINDDDGSLKISGDAKIIAKSNGIYISEKSTNVYIEMNGGSIESSERFAIFNRASDGGSKIVITGGKISSANKNGIFSKCPVYISGGYFFSGNENYPTIFCYGSNAFVSISDGNFVSKNSECILLTNGAKGKISGGTFSGCCAIGIDDANSGLVEEVRDAIFNTKYSYALWHDASVKIGGVIYKNAAEKNSTLKVNFNDSDKNKINSVEVYGKVEVTDKFGVKILNRGETYEYIKSFDNIIKYWQAHLFNVYGLKYSAEILSSLYFGLQTNKIILLVGTPGTGKTTLVKYLAKSFQFEDAAIIPVQPNWTDKSDLLGYYNPLEKSYISTDFLDALLKFCRLAEDQPDKLFIICLDEMNLAHVEYYFAEFLSALQTDRKITIYAESIEKIICRELEASGVDFSEKVDFAQMNFAERKYFLELWQMHDMIEKIPSKLTIPLNVKFFGTLNQDDTTLDLSPKVIDRAYIIRLEMFDEDLNFDGDFKNSLEYQPLENYPKKFPADVDKNNFKNAIANIAPISYRLTAQIFGNENFDSWQEIIGGRQLEDFIISACILPKVRFDDDVYKMKIDELKNLCSGHKLSEKILSVIDSENEVDFWRR